MPPCGAPPQAAHTELQAEKEQLESELTTTKTAAQEASEYFKNELNFKQNDINELNSAVEQHSNQQAIVQAVQTAHGNEKADLEARLSEMSSVMESLNEQLNVATSTAQRYRLHAITRAIAASAGEVRLRDLICTRPVRQHPPHRIQQPTPIECALFCDCTGRGGAGAGAGASVW